MPACLDVGKSAMSELGTCCGRMVVVDLRVRPWGSSIGRATDCPRRILAGRHAATLVHTVASPMLSGADGLLDRGAQVRRARDDVADDDQRR